MKRLANVIPYLYNVQYIILPACPNAGELLDCGLGVGYTHFLISINSGN